MNSDQRFGCFLDRHQTDFAPVTDPWARQRRSEDASPMRKQRSSPSFLSVKTIFRSSCKSHFTLLPNSLLRDESVSLRARGLLAMILTHSEDWIITKEWVLKQIPEGRQALATTYRELETAGYAVMCEQRNETGKITANVWTFHDVPVPYYQRTKFCSKRQSDEKPLSGNPSSGNAVSGNPATKNTSSVEEQSSEEHTPPDGYDFPENLPPQELEPLVEHPYQAPLSRKAPPSSAPPPSPELEIYNLYPRKAARPAALRSIKTAIKKIGFDRLKSEVEKYAAWHKASAIDPQYTPMPATWFNQDRWDDTPDAPVLSPATKVARLQELRLAIRNSPAFRGGPYYVDFATDETKKKFADDLAALRAINPGEDLDRLRS